MAEQAVTVQMYLLSCGIESKGDAIGELIESHQSLLNEVSIYRGALDEISMISHNKKYDHIRVSKWENTLRDAVDIARKALTFSEEI